MSGHLTIVVRVLEVSCCWAPKAHASPEVLYLLGSALERNADGWYRQVRALDMTARYGVSYEEALREALLPMVARPNLVFNEQKRRAQSTEISLDDVGLGDGLDDMDPVVVLKRKKSKKRGRSRKEKGGADSMLARGLAELEGMAARLARMRRLVDGHERAEQDPVFAMDSLSTEDPEFGPWFGEGPLEVTAQGLNLLAADAGKDGEQDWRFVAHWRSLGPFPLTRMDLVTPGLPDVVWADNETCRVQCDALEKYSGPATISWTTANRLIPRGKPDAATLAAHGEFGYVFPPKALGVNPFTSTFAPVLGTSQRSGTPHSTVYLCCDIRSPADMELWAGLGVNRQGRLWLDDRLFWQGPSVVDPSRHETVSLIRIPFRKGINRLMLRLDTDFSTPYCWLRLCLTGGPRSAAEAKAKGSAGSGRKRRLRSAGSRE